MSRFCTSCGFDAGFDVQRCPSCGAGGSAPAAQQGESAPERWEKTVIEPDFTPMPGGRDRPRFGARQDFYESVKPYAGARRERLRFDDGTDNDRTVIDRRPDLDLPDDATVIMKSGRRAHAGPLVYVIERTGIRAGKAHLLQEETSIGRGHENDIVLGDESVSKRHAKIRVEDGKFVFWDLASTNFSFLVGRDGSRTRILEPHALADGESVLLGDFRLTYIEVERDEA